jgi:hypothetical protein
MEANCGNCRFWQEACEDADLVLGSCRKSPPALCGDLLSQSDDESEAWLATFFPVTTRECWCGEHQEAPDRPE